jgi:hypothetical protein
MQRVPGGKASIQGGRSIGHSKQDSVYVHVSYSERFPRQSYITLQYTVQTSNTHVLTRVAKCIYVDGGIF